MTNQINRYPYKLNILDRVLALLWVLDLGSLLVGLIIGRPLMVAYSWAIVLAVLIYFIPPYLITIARKVTGRTGIGYFKAVKPQTRVQKGLYSVVSVGLSLTVASSASLFFLGFVTVLTFVILFLALVGLAVVVSGVVASQRSVSQAQAVQGTDGDDSDGDIDDDGPAYPDTDEGEDDDYEEDYDEE